VGEDGWDTGVGGSCAEDAEEGGSPQSSLSSWSAVKAIVSESSSWMKNKI